MFSSPSAAAPGRDSHKDSSRELSKNARFVFLQRWKYSSRTSFKAYFPTFSSKNTRKRSSQPIFLHKFCIFAQFSAALLLR
jgi:hypothetical protein